MRTEARGGFGRHRVIFDEGTGAGEGVEGAGGGCVGRGVGPERVSGDWKRKPRRLEARDGARSSTPVTVGRSRRRERSVWLKPAGLMSAAARGARLEAHVEPVGTSRRRGVLRKGRRTKSIRAISGDEVQATTKAEDECFEDARLADEARDRGAAEGVADVARGAAARARASARARSPAAPSHPCRCFFRTPRARFSDICQKILSCVVPRLHTHSLPTPIRWRTRRRVRDCA